jgi:uncharacterized membrane protein YqjE
MATEANRSVADVVADMVGNVEGLVRSEVRLAITSAKEEVAAWRRSALLLGVSVVAAGLGVMYLLLAGVFALATVMPAWAAALIVSVVALVTGGACFAAATTEIKRAANRPHFAAVAKEIPAWVKQHDS